MPDVQQLSVSEESARQSARQRPWKVHALEEGDEDADFDEMAPLLTTDTERGQLDGGRNAVVGAEVLRDRSVER